MLKWGYIWTGPQGLQQGPGQPSGQQGDHLLQRGQECWDYCLAVQVSYFNLSRSNILLKSKYKLIEIATKLQLLDKIYISEYFCLLCLLTQFKHKVLNQKLFLKLRGASWPGSSCPPASTGY